MLVIGEYGTKATADQYLKSADQHAIEHNHPVWVLAQAGEKDPT